mgnify:FL=1
MYPVIADMVRQTPDAEQYAGDLRSADVVTDLTDLEAGKTSTSFDFQKSLPLIAIVGLGLYVLTKK